MEKKQLVVLGLSASPASNNAYALIMKEIDGNRRLPIIIGAFEAQAIALEMEGVQPPRPMTHDLLKHVIDNFDEKLSEVFINDLKDGTFFARLIFEYSDAEIDARPSDAIALAVRCNVPIYVNSEILDETGIIPQDEAAGMEADSYGQEADPYKEQPEAYRQQQPKPKKSKIEQLQDDLDKAIKEENYERAAELRDEIKNFLESS